MDERIKRLKKWFSNQCTGPYKIQFNPTNNCNLNCPACYARGKPVYNPQTEVSTERYIELIKEAAKLDALYCDICGGGEPFTRAETTLAMMREIKKQGMIGTLITNGTLFSEEAIKELVKIGWDYINLSIDGPNAKINDPLRGEGAFNKNIKAIKLFNYWKEKFKKNLPHISIYSVISKKNYNHINELIDLVIGQRITGFYLQPVIVSEGRGQDLLMTCEDWATFREIIKVSKDRLSRNNINSNIGFINQNTAKIIKKDA